MECKGEKVLAARNEEIGINRNIVECKEVRDVQAADWMGRINRNIVECKGKSGSEFASLCTVLIETLWNVKSGKDGMRSGMVVY